MDTPNCLLIAGPQGSGKGTQCQKILEKFDFEYFEMGAILREAQKHDPIIHEYMEKGEHVPNYYIDPLIQDFIDKNLEKNILIDGYPRNKNQALVLANILINTNYKVRTILLHIDEKKVIDRMLKRGRSDDTLEVIKNRLNQYKNLTIPAIANFKIVTKSILYKVEADQTPEEVFTDISKILRGNE